MGGRDSTAELTASDGATNDKLGISVAVSGSTIVAGAFNRNNLQGAVYVFSEPSAGGWVDATQTAELTASDGAASDELGRSVAVSGSTIVAGAIGHNNDHGAVYVFSEPGSGGWVDATQTAELTASDGGNFDRLGLSVALSGSTIVAGAPNHNSNDQGAVYVFSEPGSGGWVDATQTAELTASDGTGGDLLGWSVAVSGSTIVAGAPQIANNNTTEGAVYVFSEPGSGGWVDATQTAKLTASTVWLAITSASRWRCRVPRSSPAHPVAITTRGRCMCSPSRARAGG